MPIYTVEIDGKQYDLEGDHPPSEAEARAAVGQQAAPQATAPPKAATLGVLDYAVNALPTAGGMAGGLIGGIGGTAFGMGVGGVPGAIGGATLGGATGEAAKQLINRLRGADAPASSGDAAKRIGTSAAIQGAGEVVGIGAAAAVKPVAKGLYGLALRPIKSVRDKYGLGTLIREGFENRIMPTEAGADKALALVKDSKAAQQAMEAAYDAAGGAMPSTVGVVGAATRPVIRNAAAQESAVGLSSAGRAGVRAAAKQVIDSNPATMSAVEMGTAKRVADTVADPAYAAARRTGQAIEDTSPAGVAKALSKAYRQALNSMIGEDYAKQGLTTKALYGVNTAARRIAGEPHRLTNLIAGGVGAGGAFAGGGDATSALKGAVALRLLMSPQVQARAAFALPGLARYGLRGADLASGGTMAEALQAELMARLAGQQQAK